MHSLSDEETARPTRGSYGPGWSRLRAAVFREPLVTTSTAKRRPRPVRRRRPEWRVARWMRRHPVAIVWCLLISITGALIWSEKVLNDFEIEEPFDWDMRLAARATMDIKDLLAVIGHGVTVSSVTSREYDNGYVAAYFWDRRVAVDARYEFAEETLLFVMGHECAHAMFRQGGFLIENASIERYQHHVHEVAADVLGAHLAGRVVARRRGNGLAFTDNLLEETRIVGRRVPLGPRNPKHQI